MARGEHADGSHLLRAKITLPYGMSGMNSLDLNLGDPPICRIFRGQEHYRTKNRWKVCPLYDFAYSLSDAIEGVTRSLRTLEFESHRELYDWVLEKLPVGEQPAPRQIEFA